MLDSYLSAQVLDIWRVKPTIEQEKTLQKLSKFILNSTGDSLFLLKGFAGTGKSSMVGNVVKTLVQFKQKIVLLAPTGRAAKVFESYAKQPAYTIHRKIYRQEGRFKSNFSIVENKHTHTLFFVDEASMLTNYSSGHVKFGSGCLLDDLIQFVYSGVGCKLILIGDTAQLPPIGQIVSPALESSFLEGYNLEVVESNLTEVIRQKKDSNILSLASSVRRMITLNSAQEYPTLFIENNQEVVRIRGEELIEEITQSYDDVSEDNSIIICRSNRDANTYNKGIRQRILFREEEIESGDRLLIARNNYFWMGDNEGNQNHKDFIANGEIAQIIRIHHFVDIYGFHFADVTLFLVDYNIEFDAKIILDSLHTDAPSLTSEMRQQLFDAVYADYAQQYSTKKEIFERLKKDPFLNALQVKYAYALTCHKAQGGQWKHVFVDQGYVTKEMLDLEFYRWLYTAFTRATEKLFLIRFSDECWQ